MSVAPAGSGGEPRVSILSFSPFQRDARVLRQARQLARGRRVTVFAYDWEGRPTPEGVALQPLARPRRAPIRRRLRQAGWHAAGALGSRAAADRAYWSFPLYPQAYRAMRALPAELLVANDWNALPVVGRLAAESGRPFLLDLHEDALGQHRRSLGWRLLRRPPIQEALRRYGHRADQVFTVNAHIADLYQARFGWRPQVLRNLPERASLPPFRACDSNDLRLVHHGVASASRGLDTMIRAVGAAGPRFRLDLYLVGPAEPVRAVAALARAEGQGRVQLRDPVPPGRIVETIAAYDIGLYIQPPAVPQSHYALPNKLFDFLAAGLAVCIGPSPLMAEELRRWEAGFVAEDFSAAAAAALLRGLSGEEIDAARRGARRAAEGQDAEQEHEALRRAAREALARAGGAGS